ncbi:putative sphingolipid 8-(E/Z)-desaturase [Monocercomonoides exilis]|uniref:putative sphingolipid 8-(E/Z)-desaturase n=1 Tax=Monocercomonoides exilis TaxID=2049356 RepID=UPI00355981E3|nr:putative sphingolipid 8-(E/Z)-desaturase [Monocercomonoides exilis]
MSASFSGERLITEEELMKHCMPGDLWIAIKGIVYDVSNFKHRPGQTAINRLGGKDGTETFCRYHPHINCARLPGVIIIGKLDNKKSSGLSIKNISSLGTVQDVDENID